MAFPKLTHKQMLERCDLAGVARVVSVDRAGPGSPALAKLVFLQIFKGALREQGGFAHVRLHGNGAPPLDGNLASWSDWDDYQVGATVMTHLDWNGPEELYQTTWPGSAYAVDLAQVA